MNLTFADAGSQCLKWAGKWQCIIPELIFVTKFHTDTYQYIYMYISIYLFPFL
jgi:hypothetical protein